MDCGEAVVGQLLEMRCGSGMRLVALPAVYADEGEQAEQQPREQYQCLRKPLAGARPLGRYPVLVAQGMAPAGGLGGGWRGASLPSTIDRCGSLVARGAGCLR